MAEWSYSGGTGPSAWGKMDPAWALADVGVRQSPVDLGAAEPGQVGDLGLRYPAATMDVVDSGHGIHLVPRDRMDVSLHAERFTVIDVHAHTPAEHVINGAVADAEVHIVHEDRDGKLTVVAVLIEVGESSGNAIEVFAAPDDADVILFDLNELLPTDVTGVYSYVGSLTTPPCTEGVQWYVHATPLVVSHQQIAQVASLQGRSSRPVQPLHGRRIVLG